jgi:hypothetical protein
LGSNEKADDREREALTFGERNEAVGAAMSQRVLVFGCELNVALQYESRFTRRQTPVQSVQGDGDFGKVLAEFDPTHIIVGTERAFQVATDLVGKRGSDAKIGRHRA